MKLIFYILSLAPATYLLIYWYRTSEDFRDTAKILGTIIFYLGIILMTLFGIFGILFEIGVIKP